jgi:hypothetical protein
MLPAALPFEYLPHTDPGDRIRRSHRHRSGRRVRRPASERA